MTMLIKIAVGCIVSAAHIALIVVIVRRINAFCAYKKDQTGVCECNRELFPRVLLLAEGMLILLTLLVIDSFFN
jgi:hypothetical protein